MGEIWKENEGGVPPSLETVHVPHADVYSLTRDT